MVNCVHPTVLESALGEQAAASDIVRERLIGLQANTSRLSPEELDEREDLDTESPGSFAEAMVKLHRKYGIKILGGCCGTTHVHLEEVARRVAT
jgi:homocysteine S-methyltransferase